MATAQAWRAIADDDVRGARPIEQHHTARRGAREVRFHPDQFGRRDRRYDDLWRAGFCLGIDLPLAPERLRELPLRRLGSKTDAVELLCAAGTFLTVIAVSSIILGEIAHSRKRGYRPARLDSRRVHADCRRNHRAITRGYFLRLNGPFVRRLR